MTQNVHADSVGSDPQTPPWWTGRPRRSRGDRKVAGVAGGLGRAFGVDPVLIRVAFVVLAIFGGFGVLLYALGWLLLPADGDQVSAAEALLGRGHSSVSPALAVLLVVVMLGSAGSIFNWGLPFWPVVVAAVVVAVVAHKRRRAGRGGCGRTDRVDWARGNSAGGDWARSDWARSDWNQRGQQFADRAAQWGSRAPWTSRPRLSRPWTWGSSGAGANSGSADGTDAGSPFGRPAFWDSGEASGWAPPTPGSRVGAAPPSGPEAGRAPNSDAPPSADRPTGPTAPDQTPMGATAAPTGGLTNSPADPPSPEDLLAGGRRTPPAWDPLGAAPFAWDLPDPTPLPAEPLAAPGRRTALSRAVLGLALLAGAIAAAGAVNSWWTLSWAQVSGITLAVVAAGLLIGSLFGSGRRLIGPGIFLSLLTLALTVTGISGTTGYGHQTWTPTATDVVAEQPLTYFLNAGYGELDLRQLPVAEGKTVTVDLEVKAGQATVILPKDVTADVTCSARLGQVDCLGKSADGVRPDVSAHQGGRPGAGTVTLAVHANTGHVEVRNG